MPAHIDSLWRFRLKGGAGTRTRQLSVNTVVGVADDRQFGIRRTSDTMDAWVSKKNFFVCINEPQMACELPDFELGPGIHNDSLKASYLHELAERLGSERELVVQSARGRYSLHDTPGAFASFLNIATVDALSDYMGTKVNPRRFRMNGWIQGLAPFEELEWVQGYPGTKVIEIGDCRFRVDHANVRCKAVDANPDSAAFDLEVFAALREMMVKRGYMPPHAQKPWVMGFLAEPLHNGVITCIDPVRLVD
ncbi:MAG: MOSC domain-containing protein [Minisyncoccota bacterium]